MSARTLHAASLLLAAILLAGCAAARPALIASDLDAQSPLRLRAGQPLVITLPADRAGGYGWQLGQRSLEALMLEGEPTYTAETGSGAAPGAGAGGSETWRFLAVRRGLDELRFEYRKQAQGDDTPAGGAARVVRYTVEVD